MTVRQRLALALASTSVYLISTPADAEPTEPGELMNPLLQGGDCQLCHAFPNHPDDAADPPYAPLVGWQGSMMANAARDPVFWAGVAIADQDAPGETEECIRCHSPRAFLEGRGAATTIDELMPEDFDGVTCEACHRMTDESLIGNAQYAIDDIPDPTGVVPRRGPWEYEEGAADAPPHPWAVDPYTGSSQMCGTCHDVTTPRERVDDDGNGLGTNFNEQRTYSEWAGSAFAQPGDGFSSCQDCHMPAVEDVAGCGDNVGRFTHATGGRRHDLVGANVFVLELLREQYGDAGTAQVPDALFDLSIARTEELLSTAASVEVDAPAEVDLAAGLSGLVATVTNHSGHKLPTGYSEGRVMWLEVIARYGETVVWSSGEWVPGVGPTQDEQWRDYQAIADDFATGETLHLLLNNHWVQDTRIPPVGLQPDPQTDPVGNRYTLTEDGTWPNFDVANYEFPGRDDIVDATPDIDDDDTLDVSVRLLYLINTPEYIEFLANENRTNTVGSDLAADFDAAGGATPMVLASSDLAIPIVAFPEPTPETGDADTTAGSASTTTTGPAVDSTGDVGSTTSGTSPGDDDGGRGCNCGLTTEDRGHTTWAWFLLLPFLRRPRRTP